MRVLIIASSKFPVPAVKGGAVPNLIEELIRENENHDSLDLYCCSLFDKDAEAEAKKYSKTTFVWAKVPTVIKILDKVFYLLLSKLFCIKRLHSLSFLFQVIWFSIFTGKVLRKNDYDRVIFENSVPMLFALKLYGNKKKYADKYYIHMHSFPRRYYGNAKIFEDSRIIITVSQYVAEEISKDLRLDMSSEKFLVMQNCIDTNSIKPVQQDDKLRIELGINCKSKIVLFVGRLCKEKGIEELLNAIMLLNRKDVELLVVGANFYKSDIVSPYEEYLKNLTEKIKEHIHFSGYVNYSDIAGVYAIADVVVLPSMWDEPAGMTVIEAMACKKPVITTISGGIPEYTGNGNCILLDRSNSIVESLAKSINELLDDGERAEALALAASLHAMQFNQARYYDQFWEILSKGGTKCQNT
jgi:hypothetical protein